MSPSSSLSHGPLDEILRALLKRHLTDAEVYVKRGRSRRLERTPVTETSATSQERAWAVRAGNRRGSFFAAATGDPAPAGPWPEPAPGHALELPEPAAPETVPPWNEPSDFDTPLIGEREGLKLLESLGRDLTSELPGARLLKAVLEDGSSEAELANSRGVRARTRQRISTLYIEAAGSGKPAAQASLYVAAREPRRFHPTALARRLADRLAVAAAGAPPERDTGEILLAPGVAARLLAGILPLLVGPGPGSRLTGSRGRFGSEKVTLIDNGRFPGGAGEAPVDGEGVPTREVVLVEEGIFHQPLLAWWQEVAAHGQPSGCTRRPGWRDLPTPGPTHLYLKPEPRTPVASLLGSVSQGYYLIDVTGPGRFDLAADRFALPVCGFAVAAGRASAPVSGAWLCGGIGTFLRGIAGVGRDLTFHPLDGMIGSPTVLVLGLELRAAAE
ncbi:MAG TPA: metallopeptidase TldD-related protein [Thermoanaerobaculia bacterium]|nr:metallopeptidase TldD-related protein [Thermoanaerobaculia bacterium]